MYYFGFFLKKLISAFLLPFPICLIIIIIGVLFLWFTKRQKLGKILVSMGCILLLIINTSVVSYLIISPLDNAYSIYNANKNKSVKYVVVLSGGASFKDGIPMNTDGSTVTLSRLMEGLRVCKANPGSKIILTGGPFACRIPLSVIEGRFLLNLGFPVKDLILDTQSLDTHEEAVNVKRIVKDNPFVLVTSAIHMTRAIKLFEKLQMHPIPAPTDFMITNSDIDALDYVPIPNAKYMYATDRAIHEYLGIVWSKIRGQL